MDDIEVAGPVVVTGAANGIGRATALLLAGRGRDLVVCDRDEAGLGSLAAEVRELRRDVRAEVLDVRDATAVQEFLDAAGTAVGGLAGLVNNAGGTYRSPFVDSRSKGDRALVDENFTSVVEVTRAALAHLRPGSAIVNVTSSEAFQAAPGFGVYAAMKAAVENLTRTLALELADAGIRVNSVAPDGIPTAGDEELAAAVRSEGDHLPPPVPPLGRFGAPEECAEVVAFLLGGRARFVTGTCVHVDGGLHAAGGWHRVVRDGAVPSGGAIPSGGAAVPGN